MFRNPILRLEAVSGRRLFTRDLSALAEFVSLTAREYEDKMAQWQRAMRMRQMEAGDTPISQADPFIADLSGLCNRCD